MLTAREEAADLVQNPLPREIILEPLALVYALDRDIEVLQARLKDLADQRTKALDYAIKEQIAEDEDYRLDVKVRRIRSIDPAKFAQAFPEAFMTVCDVERQELEEQMNHLGEKIPVTLADKVLGKSGKALMEVAPGVVTIKESEPTYTVVRK